MFFVALITFSLAHAAPGSPFDRNANRPMSQETIDRITRASMLEAIRQDYVRTARSKGLRERTVIVGHALKNALIPVATIIGPATAGLITGSFIIETLFNVPGMGRLYIISILARDYPVIMGTTLLYAFLIMMANLTVDIMYGVLDPRIKVR